MKLKKRLQKLKTKRAIFPAAVADQLGKQYDDLGEKLIAINRDREAIKINGKKLARKYGKTFGKETLVKGKTYEVGFQSVEESKVFDPVLAKKLLKPNVYESLCSRQLDQRKLEKAVLKGEVSNSLFLKMFVQSRKGCERTVIRPRRKK